MNRREFLSNSGTLLAAAQLPRSAQARALAYGDYASHDAVGLAELIACGEVSAGEVLEAAIARAEAVNAIINAMVLKHYELARAAVSQPARRAVARRPVASRRRGTELSAQICWRSSARLVAHR